MSRLFTVRQILEKSLRLIGAFAITDDQADTEELNEAQDWFELILSMTAGTKRLMHLVPETIDIPMLANEAEYSLASVGIGDGIQFPIHAVITNIGGGNPEPVEIMTRRQFDELDITTTGSPYAVHIDRLEPSLTMRVHPKPAVADKVIRLTVQKYPTQVSYDNKRNRDLNHDWPASWQMWMIYMVGANIGNGPVRKLPSSDIAGYYSLAQSMEKRLDEYNEQEHRSTPAITKGHDV